MPRIKQQTIGGKDKWEVENAVDTLQRAEEIKRDKSMMKAVSIEAKRRQVALKKIIKPSKRKK